MPSPPGRLTPVASEPSDEPAVLSRRARDVEDLPRHGTNSSGVFGVRFPHAPRLLFAVRHGRQSVTHRGRRIETDETRAATSAAGPSKFNQSETTRLSTRAGSAPLGDEGVVLPVRLVGILLA